MPGSARTFRFRLAMFGRLVEERHGRPVHPAEVTRDDVVALMARPSWGARTAYANRSTIRSFYTWLAERGEVSVDPTFGVRPPKYPRRRARDMAPSDVERLRTSVLGDLRSELVVEMMWTGGMRCCEVAGARRESIDVAAGVLVVVGKGDEEREVHLVGPLASALEAYLAEVPGASGPLLRQVRYPHLGLQPIYVSRLVSNLCWRAGVKRYPRDGVSAHAGRHTAATNLHRASGGDLALVQEFLGHADIGTTRTYVGVHSRAEMRAAMIRSAGLEEHPGMTPAG